MKWFENRTFDTVLVVNVANDPESNKDYSWVFKNAIHVLGAQGELIIVGATEKQPGFKYTQEHLREILALGYRLLSPKGGEPVTDQKILKMPSETKSSVLRTLLNRSDVPEGATFTVGRSEPGAVYRDVMIRFGR